MSQTRDQQRFTISEVTADWHEQIMPQRIMWPSTARANGQLDWTTGAASRHTIAPISHTRPSSRSRSYYSFPVPLRVGGHHKRTVLNSTFHRRRGHVFSDTVGYFTFWITFSPRPKTESKRRKTEVIFVHQNLIFNRLTPWNYK